MSGPGAANQPPSLDPRLRIIGVVAVLAALYALVQHTGVAPFPHKADDFIGGFAVGAAIAGAIGWFSTRR